ncbi:MAG: type II toxin-antitoxin system death-on-curing family toxin [Pseudomonadota bacterium]
MSEPVWVPLQAVYIIHDRQIARHGGAPGIRDRGLLEQACDRARNKYVYDSVPLIDCAAAYGFGIAKAHAFIDGNKRTAFVTMATFLRLNGRNIKPDAIEGVRVMEGLAAGEIGETEFARWIAANLSRNSGWGSAPG